MTDTSLSPAPGLAANPDSPPPGNSKDSAGAPPPAPAFQFTESGCRTDVRIGALLVLVAVFLWLWVGPKTSSQIFLLGVPFLLWGIPQQALQARRQGRPGYPWKLGLALAILGAFQWHDLRFREFPTGPVRLQDIGPMLTAAGVWILAWWPVAGRQQSAAQTTAPVLGGP